MSEFEQKILQLADIHPKPDEYIRHLENSFSGRQLAERADYLLAAGKSLFKFSHFELALGCWTSALKYYEDIGDDYDVLTCHVRLGVTYSCLGQLSEAITHHKTALQIAKKSNAKDAKNAEAGCNTNLGIAYREMGDFRSAIEYLVASLEIARQIRDTDLEGKCYTNLGNTYDCLGDFRRAIEYHNASLKIAKALMDEAGEIGCHADLGTTYLNIGEFQDASDSYERALDIIKSSAYKGEEYRPEALTCYNGLGNVFYRLGEARKAISQHEISLKIAQDIGDRLGESTCYGNLGNDYQVLEEFEKALRFHECSLKIAKETKARNAESKSIGNMGLCNLRLGKFKKAIECYESSMQIAEQEGDIECERINNLALGAAYYDCNAKLAFEYLKKSIDQSGIMGRSLVEEKHEIGFYGATTEAYRLMIPLCVKLGKEEDAFHYTEQSKSKAFLDILAAAYVKPSDQLTEQKSLLTDERACLARLREIQLRDLRNSPHPAEIGEVDSITKRLSDIYEEMDKIDADYVSMRRGRPRTLGEIENVISSEKKDVLLIEYFTTDESVFAFVVSEKGLRVEHISLPREKLQTFVQTYRREVGEAIRTDGNTGLELSKYLLEPLVDHLNTGSLIYVVPHGVLHYLPFHALILHDEPLIKRNPVCYSPAASIISYCKSKGSGRLLDCASFGIVFEEEAKEVASIFNAIPYLDEAANKEKVIECANRDIVHLSCHGYFDNLDPLSSGVLLHNEELFTAREVFDTRINAELVTLSACQTGLNERKPGDELIGLTRAFLYAGAPSVVVSLWSVSGKSTQELMIEFYQLLKQGKDKATALQEAQIQIMKKDRYSHPYFWAPFVLVGDWK